MSKYLLLLLVLVFVPLVGCTQSSTNELLGKDVINNFEELKKFDRTIKFPTYAPFTVNSVQLNLLYRGPQKIEENKLIQLEKDNPKYQVIEAIYTSKKKPELTMTVTQTDSSITAPKNDNQNFKEEIIEFGDGLEGVYLFNGATQMFSWEEDGVSFKIYLLMRGNDNKSERFSEEEIIKIAESFVEY